MKSTDVDELFDTLDVYSEYDRERYQKIEYRKIETATPKAALLDGKWIPKSQMKCGTSDEIYVSNWMFDKLNGL